MRPVETDLSPTAILARIYALEEMFAFLAANVYSSTELASIAEDYRLAAERLVTAPEGTVMIPSATSPKIELAARIQTATSSLFAYAVEIKQAHDPARRQGGDADAD